MEQEVRIKPTIRGLEISRRAEERPRVVSMPSASCLLDGTVLKAVKVEDPEMINFGLQGQYLTGGGDALVVRAAPRVDRERAVRLINNGMELVAELWKRQAGLELAEPVLDGSHLRLVPADRKMAEFASATTDLRQNRFVAVAPFRELVQGLDISRGELAPISRAHERIASKNNAMEILSGLGIPVPATISFEKGNDISLLDERRLAPGKRYIIKPDGGVGGIGIRSNGGVGYDSRAVVRELRSMAESQSLPERFQIQEFVKGLSLGAVAVLDGKGRADLASVHRMVDKEGLFVGIEWNRALDQKLRRSVGSLFDTLARAKDYPLTGPVGLDLQYDGKELFVIEVNPRVTGASPVGVLLSEEQTIAARRGPRNFAINDVFIDIAIKIPEKRFEDRRELANVFEAVVAKAAERNPDPANRTLVLPQGLSPFDASKIIFVNDKDGLARQDLISRLGV